MSNLSFLEPPPVFSGILPGRRRSASSRDRCLDRLFRVNHDAPTLKNAANSVPVLIRVQICPRFPDLDVKGILRTGLAVVDGFDKVPMTCLPIGSGPTLELSGLATRDNK